MAGDPARATRIAARAAKATKLLTPGFPGDASRGTLRRAAAVLDAFFARHADLACPALDPESGLCELYEWRPVACRTYGPPARFSNERTEPCPLCFRDCGDELPERCRLETDPDGLEGSLLEALGVVAGGEWQTLIAFALLE